MCGNAGVRDVRDDVRTLILCGGKGTRARPRTLELPKPLLDVGGRPVLAHVMDIYARQGFCDFVLAAGFKVELIDEFAKTLPATWQVEVVDTGVDTNTGGRVMQCAAKMGDRYFLTYADGLGDVDLAGLLEFHLGNAGSATVTVVPLPSQYGTIDSDGDGRCALVRFTEKPRSPDYWINVGFFYRKDGPSGASSALTSSATSCLRWAPPESCILHTYTMDSGNPWTLYELSLLSQRELDANSLSAFITRASSILDQFSKKLS